MRTIITRYDGAQQAELAALMQGWMGRTLAPPAGFHRADRSGG
ncbi:hypothetical protein ACFSHQ_27905 [Gemmobacter lanyuensis]